MELTRRIKELFWAGSLAAMTAVASQGCIASPAPACDYNTVVVETEEQRIERLGENTEVVTYDSAGLQQRIEDAVDCSRSHEGILATEPFSSNIDSFNFWYSHQSCQEVIPGHNDIRGRRINVVFAHEDESQTGVDQAAPCDLPNRAIIVMSPRGFRAHANSASLQGLDLSQMNLGALPHYRQQLEIYNERGCHNAIERYCRPGTNLGDVAQLMCDAIAAVRGNQDPSLDHNICPLIALGGRDLPLGTAFISINNRPSTVVHELAHLLQILDEYPEEGKIPQRYEGTVLELLRTVPANCYPAETQEECERSAPWVRDGVSNSCHQGCNYVMELADVPVWRSEERSTMYYSGAGSLGPWNETLICHAIFAITHRVEGICEDRGYGEVAVQQIYLEP